MVACLCVLVRVGGYRIGVLPTATAPLLPPCCSPQYDVPPDDAVELPAHDSARVLAGALASGAAGGLVVDVAADVAATAEGGRLPLEELEVMVALDLGYRPEVRRGRRLAVMTRAPGVVHEGGRHAVRSATLPVCGGWCCWGTQGPPTHASVPAALLPYHLLPHLLLLLLLTCCRLLPPHLCLEPAAPFPRRSFPSPNSPAAPVPYPAALPLLPPTQAVVSHEDGTPDVALVGSCPDGMTRHVVAGDWPGSLMHVPGFEPLAAIAAADGYGGAAAAEEDEGEEADGGEGGAGSAAQGPGLGYGETIDWEEEEAAGRSGLEELAVPGWSREQAFGPDPDAVESITPASVVAMEEAAAAGDAEGVLLAAAVPPMAPTRVWVVVGGGAGEHAAREAGMDAGANVLAKLAVYQDLVVGAGDHGAGAGGARGRGGVGCRGRRGAGIQALAFRVHKVTPQGGPMESATVLRATPSSAGLAGTLSLTPPAALRDRPS